MAGDPLPDKGVHAPTLSSVILLSVCGRCEGWEKSAEARQRLVGTTNDSILFLCTVLAIVCTESFFSG